LVKVRSSPLSLSPPPSDPSEAWNLCLFCHADAANLPCAGAAEPLWVATDQHKWCTVTIVVFYLSSPSEINAEVPSQQNRESCFVHRSSVLLPHEDFSIADSPDLPHILSQQPELISLQPAHRRDWHHQVVRSVALNGWIPSPARILAHHLPKWFRLSRITNIGPPNILLVLWNLAESKCPLHHRFWNLTHMVLYADGQDQFASTSIQHVFQSVSFLEFHSKFNVPFPIFDGERDRQTKVRWY